MTNPQLHRFSVEVPATTANLGPGFDCLGMALELRDKIDLQVRDGEGPLVRGEGASRSYCELAHHAAVTLSKRVGKELPALEVCSKNAIPIARGLGSSAAAIVGGLVAANGIFGDILSQDELLSMAVQIEGHPDNVTPALLGGFRAMVLEGEDLYQVEAPLPAYLRVALFIPSFHMPTEESRRLLPTELSRRDAVYNISRAALLVASLATGDMRNLAIATQDRLHQPARAKLFPAMEAIFKAALDVGAKGVFLSGGGPTILAFATEDEAAIGEAMKSAAASRGVQGEVILTRPSAEGARLIEG